MAKKEHLTSNSKFKIISIRDLAKATRMDYFRLYYTLRGRYANGLSDQEKTEITNALHAGLQPWCEFLGMEISLRRKPK